MAIPVCRYPLRYVFLLFYYLPLLILACMHGLRSVWMAAFVGVSKVGNGTEWTNILSLHWTGIESINQLRGGVHTYNWRTQPGLAGPLVVFYFIL